jgi:hypothetical protein
MKTTLKRKKKTKLDKNLRGIARKILLNSSFEQKIATKCVKIHT